MRCPDPACAATIPDALWHSCNIRDHEPWDADAPDDWHWTATCPTCRRYIAATALDGDSPTVEPGDGWCCPLCGAEAKVTDRHRGPVDAALRCIGGCGALIAVGRAGL